MRWYERAGGRCVRAMRFVVAIALAYTVVIVTAVASFAQGTPPRITPSEATVLRSVPYTTDIESRLTFISGLYKQMPNLFLDGAKYDFDMLEILTDQATLMSKLNAEPEYLNALQNRPPLSQVSIVPVGNQGNRMRVPVRGEIPPEAIENFQNQLVAAAETVDAELALTKSTWSAEAVANLIKSDLARLDPSKPNPGQIVAALQSLLSPVEKKEAAAIKDFSEKIRYLSQHVDPDKVRDPALFDPARLRLSTVFTKTPTLEEVITYSSEYTRVKDGLSDRLALYAELKASHGSESSKAGFLENVAKINKDQLTYLADEADILRPIFETFTPDKNVSASLVKNVASTLGDVFAKAPTTLVELSPVVLTEQPWWYGILRGFVSGDCSSQHSFAYPNDPGERTFFISDPGSPGDYKGIVTASSVVKGGKRGLYVLTIHGARLSPADVFSVLYGLDQIKGSLGFDTIELPTTANLKILVNRDELLKAMDAIASKGALGDITYQHDKVRSILEGLQSHYNEGIYDSRKVNSQSRAFVPDPQLVKGLNASNAWAPVQIVDTSLPTKATAIQLFHDLLYAKRYAGTEAFASLLSELKSVGSKWGLNVDDVVGLMEAAKNPQNLPLKNFEIGINERLAKLLDSHSVLPRSADTAQSLVDSRLDWFREGYSKTPDLLKPENSARAVKVLKSFVSDLKLALKDSKAPAYLFNNPEVLLTEPILSTLTRDGIVQEKLLGRGHELLAQSYRALLTGKAPEFASSGEKLNKIILQWSDHRGDKLTTGIKAPAAPLAEGPVRTAVTDILNRYEISALQRTQQYTYLEDDIIRNGRDQKFWDAFREAVRTWDTAPLPEGVPRNRILETAVIKFGALFSPTYMELLPTIHGASSNGRGLVAGFLSAQKTIPPSVLNWYVEGFLKDSTAFPVDGLARAEVPASVWNKIQTLPPSEARIFLLGHETWPQSTIDWFLSKFNETTIGQELEWQLLSLLYDRKQVPAAEMARIEDLVLRHTAEALLSFEWDSDVLPPKMREAILREAIERPSAGSLIVAAKYVDDIPAAFFDKMVEYLNNPPSKELGWSAVEFLRDTVTQWPESVKLKLISEVAPKSSSQGWFPDGNVGKLFGQLSGDSWIRGMRDISNPTFTSLLSKALEHRPGIMVGEDPSYGDEGFFPHDRRRVNLNAATLKAILNGQLSGIPDAFAVLEVPGSGLPNSGITFEIFPLDGRIGYTSNGTEIISAADLILTLLEGRATKVGWTVDPRNPASVGDMVKIAEYAGFLLDADSEGGKVLDGLRTVAEQNLKPPTRPGEVVVRGGATFTKAVVDVVTKYGGDVYTGEGGRTRVVTSDGSVIEFPSLESRDYLKVIGDRVAFIEVVGGTATGAAATSLANQVPADVQAEFNKLNPVAGNEFVEEGVNQVIDRMTEAGKPPVVGGLPIEGITDGQLAVGKRSSFENIRDAYHEAGNEAKLKAYEMINDVMDFRQKGFGVAGMIASFVMLESANTVFDQQINAIAAGNWDAYDDSYRYAAGKLPETAMHTAAGIALFEGAGIGFGALSTAGATLTAGGSTGLGAAASGAGAVGTMALTATGVAFAAAAIALEVNEIGKTKELMDHLDVQAAQVGMTDDSWAYSDNAIFKQWQLEAEVGVELIGGAWNSVIDSIKETFSETVKKGLGSPDGKVWAFDSSFENGDIGADGSAPNPMPPSQQFNDWMGDSARAGNGDNGPANEPLVKVPPWVEDLAHKGSVAAKGLSALLGTVHDVFPSLVGAPTSRGVDVLKSPAQAPQSASTSSKVPGVLERMEDAIRRANQKEGITTPPSDDMRFDDLVRELGTDPAAWSEAFEAGLLSMSDIERVFGRMKAAEPEDTNAPPPPQIVKGPSNTVVKKGASFSLSAEATGQNLYYVWALDGEPLGGLFVGPSITISNADFDDAGSYVVYVSDGKSLVASAPAKVEVIGFTEQPAPLSGGLVGKSFELSAQVSSGNASYQWMKNGAPVAGATSARLSFASLKATDVGTYTLVAKVGSFTLTSDPAAVNVLEFAKEPEFRVAAVGSRATLSASGKVTLASGASAPVTYQWLKNGAVMSGQTGAVLTIASALKSDTGNYTVKIIHDSGAVESAPGHLEVIDRTLNATSTLLSPAFGCTIPQAGGGALSCKETSGNNQWGEAKPNIMGATSIALGARHGCAITALTKAACWGDNSSGQLTPPADLAGVVALGLGDTYSCALLNTGLIRCWGTRPTIPGVNQVIAIESSAAGICVKTLSGDRLCWGPRG